MAELTANTIIRGGRPEIKKECATDAGYGHANRPLVRQILSEMQEASEYDPRFDYRDTGQDNLEPWQRRRKFG